MLNCVSIIFIARGSSCSPGGSWAVVVLVYLVFEYGDIRDVSLGSLKGRPHC